MISWKKKTISVHVNICGILSKYVCHCKKLNICNFFNEGTQAWFWSDKVAKQLNQVATFCWPNLYGMMFVS